MLTLISLERCMIVQCW